MKDRIFSDKIFCRKLLMLTAPIALQSLMLASVAAADAIMLGSVAQDSMAAVSLATQIQFIQNMILSAVVSAAAILGAQYWGKGDVQTVDDIFCIALRYCGIASLLFFVGCVFFPRYLMVIFTNEEALIAIGIRYLKVAGWSYLLTGISQCYLVIMKVSGHASQTAMISSGAVILNIVLNAVFIFGLFGLPAMEVQGAALATLIARVVELVWCVLCSRRKGYVRPQWSRFRKRNPLLASDFWKCAFPLLGASLFWGVGFTSYTAFMGHMGTDAAASNSVASVVRDLICCLCNGISSGGGILVGHGQSGAGEAVWEPSGEAGVPVRIPLYGRHAAFDPCGAWVREAYGGCPEVSGGDDGDYGVLYDWARGEHHYHQRHFRGRRGYAVRSVQPGGVHVGDCRAAGRRGDIPVRLAGAGGVRLYLPGRGGEDSLGDGTLQKVWLGEGLDPGDYVKQRPPCCAAAFQWLLPLAAFALEICGIRKPRKQISVECGIHGMRNSRRMRRLHSLWGQADRSW